MFRLLKIENARINVHEPEFHDAASNEEISLGEALVLSGGVLTKCGATATPEFISMRNLSASETSRNIPVARVTKDQIYEVPVMATPTALKAGNKVTLHTDGLQVTATTTDGKITVINTNGAKVAGDTIVVRI